VEKLLGPSPGQKIPEPNTIVSVVASETPAAAPGNEEPAPGESTAEEQPVLAARPKPPAAVAPAPLPEQAPIGQAPTILGRPRVLCIESPANRMTSIEHQLEGLGMDVVRVSDLEEGFWSCFTENPQIIIVQCAKEKERLWELLDRLSQHPVTRKLPVFVINEDQQLLAGNLPDNKHIHLLRHPLEWEELLSAIEDHLGFFHWNAEDRLAVAEGFSPVERSDSVSGTETSAPAGPASLSILCIDDDPVVARSITLRLKPYGIEVISAENGTQGYLIAAAKCPDLILLDMNMPSGDGHYVLSKLKENERTLNIPIIILTIETHPGVRRQMLSVGAEAFICKPVRWRKLFAEMARHVELPDQLIKDYHLAEDLASL
jgi:CheY-like chemotaxis protein